MNASQSKILGYVIASGGNHMAGVSISEIVNGTGLSQNTVYTAIRNGVPGVIECINRHPINSAKMYYASNESLAKAMASDPSIAISDNDHKKADWLSSPELSKWERDVRISLNKNPATFERIGQLVDAAANPPPNFSDVVLREYYVTVGLAIAAVAINVKVDE